MSETLTPSAAVLNPPRKPLRTALLVCITLLTGLMIVVMEPVLPEMAEQFRAVTHAEVLVRLSATIASIGVAIGMPLTGWMLSRFTHRHMLLAGLLVFAVTGVAPAMVEDLHLIIALRLLTGIGLGAILTTMLALIGAYYDDRQRARVFALQTIAGAVGVFGFAALSGLLAHAHWRLPFLLFGTAFVLLIAAWALIDEPAAHRAAAGPDSAGEGFTRRLLFSRWIGGTALLLLLSNLAAFAYLTQMPFILKEMGSGDPRLIGLVAGAPAGLAALSGAFALPWLARHVQAHRVFAVILLGLSLSLVITSGAQQAWHLAVAGFLATIAPTLLAPLGNLVALAVASPAARGMALAILGTAASIGQFISPLVVQPLAEVIGLPLALSAIAALCGTVGLWVIRSPGSLRVVGATPAAVASH